MAKCLGDYEFRGLLLSMQNDIGHMYLLCLEI